MQSATLAAWGANLLALVLILITLKQVRNQQKVAHSDAEYNHWSKIDDLMLEYPDPEIHEVWIGPKYWKNIIKEFQGERLIKFLKQRAFSAQIIGMYWWNWQIRKETRKTIEGLEIEAIPVDLPILIEMWSLWGIRDDYDGYPEFVAFLDHKWQSSNRGK